jgi:acyl carrier protein
MTAGLSEADLARMARSGVEAIEDAQGAELFDRALIDSEPLALALPLNRSALRSMASAGALPAVFRGLVKAGARRPAAAAGSLATRLAAIPEEERSKAVLAAVLTEVAVVLGQDSPAAIEPERPFKDLGFDSLAAVELRNRLGAATGVELPATAAFDYPTPAALAEYVLGSMDVAGGGSRGAEAQIEQLESALAADALGDADRVELATRLRALAAELEGAEDAAGSDRDRLETASDDELLEAIDDMAGTT